MKKTYIIIFLSLIIINLNYKTLAQNQNFQKFVFSKYANDDSTRAAKIANQLKPYQIKVPIEQQKQLLNHQQVLLKRHITQQELLLGTVFQPVGHLAKLQQQEKIQQ